MASVGHPTDGRHPCVEAFSGGHHHDMASNEWWPPLSGPHLGSKAPDVVGPHCRALDVVRPPSGGLPPIQGLGGLRMV